MDFAHIFTLIFIIFLFAGWALQYVLSARQIRHVQAARGAVPASFQNHITLEAHQKAADYTCAKERLARLEAAFGLAVLLGWTLLGGLDALNTWLGMLFSGRAPLWQELALLMGFSLIGAGLDLPFSYYRTFVLEARFGFNKTTLNLWLMDMLKGAALGTLIGLPIAALVLYFMAASGGWWWLYAWGALLVFQLLLMWIFPTFLAPLFNKFSPLEDAPLKARIEALMARAGFTAQGLFVVDGSRRSAHANAYFTGFGSSKRVVFYDTLLAKLTHAEMEAVLAHELGHFKHKHILKRMLTMFAMSLAGFALLGWLADQAWFYAALGVQAATIGQTYANDALALLLFMLIMPVFSFFIAPLAALNSRKQEFEADAYAVSQAPTGDLGNALLKLYEDNASTLTPDPWYVRFYYSHPPASERLKRFGFQVESSRA